MTLKQDEVIKRLPGNGYNIAASLRDAGYSSASCRAGTVYASLRRKIDKYYNPDRIKADILKAEQDFAKEKDNSNRARMLELRAKILGLTKELNAGQQVMVNINDTLAQLRKPPIDTVCKDTRDKDLQQQEPTSL
jgi:hypothetical protein